MGKYALRSHVVEAEEFQPSLPRLLPEDVKWMPRDKLYILCDSEGCAWCPKPGDFIVRRQDGTVRVCRPGVFAEQYVKVVSSPEETRGDG